MKRSIVKVLYTFVLSAIFIELNSKFYRTTPFGHLSILTGKREKGKERMKKGHRKVIKTKFNPNYFYMVIKKKKWGCTASKILKKTFSSFITKDRPDPKLWDLYSVLI